MLAVNSLISWKREDPILPDVSITNTTSGTELSKHPLPVHKNQFGHLTVTLTGDYVRTYYVFTCKADDFIYTQDKQLDNY